MRRLVPLLLLLALAAAHAKEVPYLTGRVNDQANLMAAEQRQRVEARLAQLEQQTGAQAAVLTVDSLDGEAIEDYANKVARTWALGQKGKDNGVLLLVAKNDRKMRIEVGYGLEPTLTDLQTSIIQNEIIIPHFKQGDFGGGVEAGVDAIAGALNGQPVQPAPSGPPPGRSRDDGKLLPYLLFGLFALGPFLLNAIRSGSWIVYFVLAPVVFFLGLLAAPLIGLIAVGLWLVLFPILRKVLPKPRSRGPGGWWIGPGWGGGGGWSGGSRGGGGGFSGGGGSFGGGGSSSSW